jgi:hypothetical protein
MVLLDACASGGRETGAPRFDTKVLFTHASTWCILVSTLSSTEDRK